MNDRSKEAVQGDPIAVVRSADPQDPNMVWYPQVYWDPHQVLEAVADRVRRVLPPGIDVAVTTDPPGLAVLDGGMSVDFGEVDADGLWFRDPKQPESVYWIAERVRRCLDVVADAVTIITATPWPDSADVSDRTPDGRLRFGRGWSTWMDQRIMSGWAYPGVDGEVGVSGYLAGEQESGPMVLRLPDLTVEGQRKPGFWER